MSACRKRVVRRGSGLTWAALGRVVSVSIVLATPWTVSATPPTVVLVWIDRAGLEAAAAPFGVEAQRSFDGALRGVTAPGFCGGSAPAPGFECVQPSGLLRVLPPLICPAVQGGRADRVETFFAELQGRRLVRGFVSRMEDTAVDFRLVGTGGAWDLDEVHRSLSPHSAGQTRTTRMRLECRGGQKEPEPAWIFIAGAAQPLLYRGSGRRLAVPTGTAEYPVAFAPPSRTLRRPGSAPAPARRA